MHYTIFHVPPKDFKATVEVSSCYCALEDKVLLVKRQPHTPQGGTWGVPGGKLEKGETPRIAIVREVYEEVGLFVDDDALMEVDVLYIRLPHVDYVYHMFYKKFEKLPDITLEYAALEEFRWVTPSEAFEMPLIAGGKEALQLFLDFISHSV